MNLLYLAAEQTTPNNAMRWIHSDHCSMSNPTTTQRLTLKEESSHKQVMNSGINNMALHNNMAKCERIKTYIIVFVPRFRPKFYLNIPVMIFGFS